MGEFEAEYHFIDNDGPIFWFKTNKNAPRGKLVAIDTRSPQPEHWIEVIPEAAETLESVDLVGDHFLAVYLKDARHAQFASSMFTASTSATSICPASGRPRVPWQAERRRDLLLVHIVHLPGDHLPLRCRQR